MTIEEKIGQLFAVWYFGGFLSVESPEYRQLLHKVEQRHIGSFAIQTSRLAAGNRTQPGLSDGGSCKRPAKPRQNSLTDRRRFRTRHGHAPERRNVHSLIRLAVAAAGRPEDAYTMGKITAIEARAAGAPWIFAPDADVNSNPDNPAINMRSFGKRGSRRRAFLNLLPTFIRGVEENGGLATAKHFPGHGDTSTDSHLDTANGEERPRAPRSPVELARHFARRFPPASVRS